jgi:hypothetical protein
MEREYVLPIGFHRNVRPVTADNRGFRGKGKEGWEILANRESLPDLSRQLVIDGLKKT